MKSGAAYRNNCETYGTEMRRDIWNFEFELTERAACTVREGLAECEDVGSQIQKRFHSTKPLQFQVGYFFIEM